MWSSKNKFINVVFTVHCFACFFLVILPLLFLFFIQFYPELSAGYLVKTQKHLFIHTFILSDTIRITKKLSLSLFSLPCHFLFSVTASFSYHILNRKQKMHIFNNHYPKSDYFVFRRDPLQMWLLPEMFFKERPLDESYKAAHWGNSF